MCGSCSAAAAPAQGALPPEGTDSALAAWRYEGAPRALILALKLRGCRSAAQPLVAAIAGICRRGGVTATSVTWVPARRSDARRRGFDHAEVLARGVAAALGLPAVAMLVRRGIQADQAGLGRHARIANLAGAFEAPEPVTKPVLLVDDLVTTGATATACATALRSAGAPQVDLAAACRA